MKKEEKNIDMTPWEESQNLKTKDILKIRNLATNHSSETLTQQKSIYIKKVKYTTAVMYGVAGFGLFLSGILAFVNSEFIKNSNQSTDYLISWLHVNQIAIQTTLMKAVTNTLIAVVPVIGYLTHSGEQQFLREKALEKQEQDKVKVKKIVNINQYQK